MNVWWANFCDTGAKPHVRSLNQENKRDTLVNAEEEKNMNMSKIGQSQLNGAFVVRLGSHIVQVRTPNPTMSEMTRGARMSSILTVRVSRLSSGAYRADTTSCLLNTRFNSW